MPMHINAAILDSCKKEELASVIVFQNKNIKDLKMNALSSN
jgi:hypothetical protein